MTRVSQSITCDSPTPAASIKGRFRRTATKLLIAVLVGGPTVWLALQSAIASADTAVRTNLNVQHKIVKIYGVGGSQGLEAYQSGFLISEDGHLVTVWSYVLDTDQITAVLNDGRRFTAEMIGADPRLEIAVLKLDATELEHFDLEASVELKPGDGVLAFSNLYGIASGNEPASLLHGIVSAVTPLAARRGTFETPYDGPVYVLDAMTNNAGSAGGALTDYDGNFVGLLGKELRSSQNNLWLNYAIPAKEIQPAVVDILAGKTRSRESNKRRPAVAIQLADLGLVMLPDILPKTPPFVAQTIPNSPAEKAGIQPDDLIVMVGTVVVQSRQDLVEELDYIDRLDPVELMILRDQELLPFKLTAEQTDDR